MPEGLNPFQPGSAALPCTGSGLYALQGGCAPESHAAAAGAIGRVRCGVWRRSYRQDCRLTLTFTAYDSGGEDASACTLELAEAVRGADAIVDTALGYYWDPTR